MLSVSDVGSVVTVVASMKAMGTVGIEEVQSSASPSPYQCSRRAAGDPDFSSVAPNDCSADDRLIHQPQPYLMPSIRNALRGYLTRASTLKFIHSGVSNQDSRNPLAPNYDKA
jgi:hypothetical protein